MNEISIWNKITSDPQNGQTKQFERKNVIIEEVENENALTYKNEEIKAENGNLNEQGKEIFNQESHNLINKKRGRKKKLIKLNKNEAGIHNKYSDDNLKRKIKTHFHNFIIAYLNMKSKNILLKHKKFGKISSDITQNIGIEFNQQLFDKKIKDIVVQISDKFLDKEKNIISLETILKKADKDSEIIHLLNMNYKDFYINYYLKSTKKTFEGEKEDESYESHIEKLEKIYGNKYIKNFKRNAESLITYFYKTKKRIRKKKSQKLISPIILFNSPEDKINNSNYDYNEDHNKEKDLEGPSKIMISVYTQTEMYISEDEDEY